MPASLDDPSPAPFQDVEVETARRKDVVQSLEKGIKEGPARRPTARTDASEVAFVELEGIEHPWNWSRRKRWFITVWTGVLLFNSTLASSAPSGAFKAISTDFNTSPVQTALVIGTFLFGYVAGPFMFAPLSEIYGRRIPFIISVTLFTAFTAACGGAKDINTLLVLRFFAGVAGACPQTNSGATIGDVWTPEDRGLPMSLFSLMPYAGPSLGPLIGGFTSTSIGWQWTFYIISIFSAFTLVITILYLPETYPPLLRYKKAKRLRQAGETQMHSELDVMRREWKRNLPIWFIRPIEMLCKELILSLVTLYTAIIYSIIYIFFSAYPIIFTEVHGLSPGLAGAAFLPLLVGTLIAVVISIWFNNRYLARVARNGGKHVPEFRLPAAICGDVVFLVSLLMLGWLGYKKSISPFAAMSSGILSGVGTVLIFRGYNTYLIDVYKDFSASALAATIIARSVMAGLLPLFTDAMFRALTIQWSCTLFAGILLLLLPVPFLFIRYGARIRQRSRFAVKN